VSTPDFLRGRLALAVVSLIRVGLATAAGGGGGGREGRQGACGPLADQCIYLSFWCAMCAADRVEPLCLEGPTHALVLMHCMRYAARSPDPSLAISHAGGLDRSTHGLALTLHCLPRLHRDSAHPVRHILTGTRLCACRESGARWPGLPTEPALRSQCGSPALPLRPHLVRQYSHVARRSFRPATPPG
jgi:hypothetical protein